ncbi:hypothetical protein OUZ56_005090 [Daphnia magna]|uniref:Uncharacterized protein n=1 Tax=Daphnia magna TaxID=35525 RepID=A0ABQ9YRR9_9CRUS|nr:hypothetical protein OUZ56_005090 [Daphnia magna]
MPIHATDVSNATMHHAYMASAWPGRGWGGPSNPQHHRQATVHYAFMSDRAQFVRAIARVHSACISGHAYRINPPMCIVSLTGPIDVSYTDITLSATTDSQAPRLSIYHSIVVLSTNRRGGKTTSHRRPLRPLLHDQRGTASSSAGNRLASPV